MITIMELKKKVKDKYNEKLAEIGEQEEEQTKTTDSAKTSPTKKWESGVSRGKANPIDDKKTWESGLTRGKANPIDDKKKWESGIKRGKANPIN